MYLKDKHSVDTGNLKMSQGNVYHVLKSVDIGIVFNYMKGLSSRSKTGIEY